MRTGGPNWLGGDLRVVGLYPTTIINYAQVAKKIALGIAVL
jgi:hypothetical protein